MRFLIATIVIIYLSISAQAIDFKEGNWQIEMKTEIVGMPMQMPPMIFEQCMDKNEMVPAQQSQDGSECKVTEQSIKGNMVTWAVECPDSKGKGRITYKGKSFDGKMEVEMRGQGGGMKMTNIMKGTYLGTCQK